MLLIGKSWVKCIDKERDYVKNWYLLYNDFFFAIRLQSNKYTALTDSYTHTYTYACISSLSYADSMRFLDSLTPSIPIIELVWLALLVASCVFIQLVYVTPCRLVNIGTSMCRRTFLMSSYLLLRQCPACIVRPGCFVRLNKGDHTTTVFRSVAFRISSRQHATLLRCSI